MEVLSVPFSVVPGESINTILGIKDSITCRVGIFHPLRTHHKTVDLVILSREHVSLSRASYWQGRSTTMACPHSESLYCIPSSSLEHTDRHWYAGVSGVSASLSLVGSTYMLLSSTSLLRVRYPEGGRRLPTNPHIIFSLALADLIACVAVICRSIALVLVKVPTNVCSNITTNCSYNCSGSHPSFCMPHSAVYPYFGDPIETILRFAYIATFMWTLVFAVDTFLRVKTILPSSRCYHIIVWSVSSVLAGSYLVTVFVGFGVRCAGKYRLIGSYFLLYLPMLVVMIFNPLLYRSTARQYERWFMETGKFSKDRRERLKNHKRMFLIYIIIFYFCWLASLANLVISIITPFVNSVSGVPFPIWILNAVTNPLQGLLNSLSYGRFGESIYTNRQTVRRRLVSSYEEERETEPFAESES